MSNIKNIKAIGSFQTYDLEIEHPDHQYYLSNGALTSNSHAVLYSFISYITAYLKAHHPIEFLLANLMFENNSNAPDAEENINKAKIELRLHGVKILPPDINKSEMHYVLTSDRELLTGLDALKFVGTDAIEDIVSKRPFKDFDDFMFRIDAHKVRSSAIQALAASGCLDSFKIPRKSIYLYCSDYRKKLQVWLKKHDPTQETFSFKFADETEWTKAELFALEKHYLGEAFICSKREAFGSFFRDKTHANLSTVKMARNKTVLPSIKAEIKSIFELKVKKENSRFLGQEMLKATIEDEFGVQCGLTIFPDQWQEIKNLLKKNKKIDFAPSYAIHFSGTCNVYENEMGIILNQLHQVVPPPQLPLDLKAKKIAAPDKQSSTPQNDTKSSELVQELEDELFSEGLLDVNEDPFSLDI